MVARVYCPGCEPEADPLTEILDTVWCTEHYPDRSGAADHVISASNYLSGSSEAGGEENRAWCNAVHTRRYAKDRKDGRP